jgi:hypothetical protein
VQSDFTWRSLTELTSILGGKVYKHLDPVGVKNLSDAYRMRRPCSDSSINLPSRLSLVSSCLALTIYQFIIFR